MVTFGTWPNGTSVTGSPLASVKRFGAGMTKSLAVPGAGGFCFCCAPMAAVAASMQTPAASFVKVDRVEAVLIASPLRPVSLLQPFLV